MHRLATMKDSPLAREALRRLREASIEAELTTEWGVVGLHVGGSPNAIIWIGDAADRELALEIIDQVRGQESSLRCPRCDYDFGGHEGPLTCPECGRRSTAPTEELTCPTCGETVPGDFDVCWSCGGAMEEA